MNTVKRLILIAAIRTLSVLTVGLVQGSMEGALAAPPNPTAVVRVINTGTEPVPVAPQGTTNVSGSVSVSDWPTSALPVSQQGTVDVSGTVGLSDNTVKLDPAGNTVKLDPTSSVNVSGTVGLADGATVRIDHLYTNSNPVKVWGHVALDPVANNRVQTTNSIDLETHQAVPLLVQVAGGGNTAQEPVQFTSTYTSNFSWTNA